MIEVCCRSCNGSRFESILNLGELPLANSYLTESEGILSDERFPLEVVFCKDCSLAQINYTVPAEKMFREYLYFSSYSETFLSHAEQLAKRMVYEERLDQDSFVIEAASNDGYLLQYYQKFGVPVLGVDPANNIVEEAITKRGVPTLPEFFTRELGVTLAQEGKKADVFHAHNVLAHVPDLNGFVQGIKAILKPRGMAIIEVPYVKGMIDNLEFDTIYHEHLCYFSLTSLSCLFERHSLMIHDVEQVTVHCGSLRIFVSHEGARKKSSSVLSLLKTESSYGLDQLFYYRSFAKGVEHLKERVVTFVRDLKMQGKKIAAYGASAKGTIMLNYFGIDQGLIDFVVDKNPYKQGRLLPGSKLPVLDPAELCAQMPDYVFLLVRNVAGEILEQQSEYLKAGGAFIVPIPEPRILDSSEALRVPEVLRP